MKNSVEMLNTTEDWEKGEKGKLDLWGGKMVVRFKDRIRHCSPGDYRRIPDNGLVKYLHMLVFYVICYAVVPLVGYDPFFTLISIMPCFSLLLALQTIWVMNRGWI